MILVHVDTLSVGSVTGFPDKKQWKLLFLVRDDTQGASSVTVFLTEKRVILVYVDTLNTL